MKIQNFDECKRKVQELSDGLNQIMQFLDSAHATIKAVKILKGAPPAGEMRSGNGIPGTFAEKVIQVFQRAGKPLMQKHAMALYREMGWPGPPDKELYRAISGAIAYLHKRKGVLVKTEAGYKLKE